MQLNEETLKKQIKSGEFSRIYLIYGNEGYLKQHYVSQIASKTVDDAFADFNLKKLDGNNTSLDEINDCVCSFPMMGEYTCTIVTDFPITDYIGDRGKIDTEFEGILSDIPETSVLVFWMDTIQVDEKNSKWAKVIKTIDSIGACCQIDKRTRSALEKLIIASASKRDCTLSKECAAYLINLVGEDMATLQNELNKVCAYTGTGEITKGNIDATVIISVEAKIFQLSRMIVKGEADKALENLANLFKLREEPIVILGVLSKAFVDMYRVKAIKECGISYSNLANDFPGTYKGRTFILDNAANDGANLTLTQLKNALDLLSDADRRLKSTGQDGKLIIEELVLRLMRI